MRMILMAALMLAQTTQPKVPEIPVPSTPEQFIVLQKNREKLQRQIADLQARLTAINGALDKATGQKAAAELRFPHYFTEDRNLSVKTVQVGEGRRWTYLRGYVDVVFADDSPGKWDIRWRYMVNKNGTIGWREYKTKIESGRGEKRSAFQFNTDHVALRNGGNWQPINAHLLILKDGEPYCETVWKADDKSAKFKPDGKVFWWEDGFEVK